MQAGMLTGKPKDDTAKVQKAGWRTVLQNAAAECVMQ